MKRQHLAAFLIAIVSACALAACGSGDKAPTPPPAKVVVKAPAQPLDPTARMAHAVVIGKSGAAVDLKYDVLNKPEPGKPIEIDLALIPSALMDSMTVNVVVMPGLTAVSKSEAAFSKLAIGEVAHHKLVVVADRPEVIYLTVTATAYAVGLSSTRSFAIPLIVSDPTPPATTAAVVPATQEKK